MSLFAGKKLLITGGTGSFGNAVLNRFITTDIGEIRIFSRDEKKQDDMRHEFQTKYPEFAEKVIHKSALDIGVFFGKVTNKLFFVARAKTAGACCAPKNVFESAKAFGVSIGILRVGRGLAVAVDHQHIGNVQHQRRLGGGNTRALEA